MNQTIKPILSSDKGTTGIYIEGNKLYYNGNPLLDATNSKLKDILNFKKYPVNIEILKKLLLAYGFNDLINSFIISDPNHKIPITLDGEPLTLDGELITFSNSLDNSKTKLFSVGMGYSIKSSVITLDGEPITLDGEPITFTNDNILNNSYAIAVADQNKFLSGNGNKFSELESIFNNRLSELSTLYNRIDNVYDRINNIQNNTDLPIQLLPEGHISDYVSFENLVIKTGSNFISQGYSNITLDGIPMTESLTGDLINNIRFIEEIEVPVYDRVIKENDILDIVIGYKLLNYTEEPSDITFDGEPITFTDENGEKSNLRWVPENENPFDFITFNGSPIRFNMYEITYGNYPLYYLSSTLQVKESTMKLGDKFLIEINPDRLIVYSISSRIKEYFIKSCRLIMRSNKINN
jgi:hypothetical protein